MSVWLSDVSILTTPSGFVITHVLLTSMVAFCEGTSAATGSSLIWGAFIFVGEGDCVPPQIKTGFEILGEE